MRDWVYLHPSAPRSRTGQRRQHADRCGRGRPNTAAATTTATTADVDGGGTDRNVVNGDVNREVNRRVGNGVNRDVNRDVDRDIGLPGAVHRGVLWRVTDYRNVVFTRRPWAARVRSSGRTGLSGRLWDALCVLADGAGRGDYHRHHVRLYRPAH